MTSYHFTRRTILLTMAALPFAVAHAASAQQASAAASSLARKKLRALEQSFNGQLGLFAINTANGMSLGLRESERFPLCSTFKMMLAAAVLDKSRQSAGLLEQVITYTEKDLLDYSPVTEQHLADGMTVAQLCAATVNLSDNAAANLLMKLLGGPAGVTAFARSIGDQNFLLDRWEPDLNSAIPGDLRDTTTPEAMAVSLQRLTLGDALPKAEREQLQTWLRATTTGASRIKAGLPADWQSGDKTGTGSYGTAHDIAVIWPPNRAPVVLAIYTKQHKKNAKGRSDIVAAAAKIVSEWLVQAG
ncbi:class A beta-lactamase [Undibacterium sp. Ren11W]|uniref:class A beta-lactamase n=1 Tax=Undibacterium sp. Ren11W TaxID=3413045 RepID=UPI003BEF5C1B